TARFHRAAASAWCGCAHVALAGDGGRGDARHAIEGKLIKIIPNSDYLKEIRNIVFSNHKNKDYDNSEVIDLFEANFNKIEMIDISYKVKLNKEELNKLLDMTPLTWNLSDVEKEGIIKKNLSEITMSFKVLVGGFKTS
ncbi:hypothetical protein VWT71_22590, partial [Xanthomonas citri pv. citri]